MKNTYEITQKQSIFNSPRCCFFPVFFNSCNKSDLGPDPSSIEQWILGTSVSIREDFSPDVFIHLKNAGINFVELRLRALQFYTDSSESEQFCQKVVQAASEAGVRIWSIHIPYGKQWDISDPLETARQGVIKRHQDFLSTVGARITTLHISDYDGIDERHWPPGRGIIEWNLVLESLLSTGYSGPFHLEYSDSPEKKAEMWKELKRKFTLD